MYRLGSSLRLLCYAKHPSSIPVTKELHIDIGADLSGIAAELEHIKDHILSIEVSDHHKSEALEQSFKKHAWHTLELEGVPASSSTISSQREACQLVQNNFRIGALEHQQFHHVNQIIMSQSEKILSYRHDVAYTYLSKTKTFFYPSVCHVHILMDGLISYFNTSPEIQNMNSVIKAAILKLAFLSIHPYPDGNGRSSRAIFNGLLRQQGYPYITIPATEKTKYFAVLQAYRKKGNMKPYMRYIFYCIRRSLSTYQDEIRSSNQDSNLSE